MVRPVGVDPASKFAAPSTGEAEKVTDARVGARTDAGASVAEQIGARTGAVAQAAARVVAQAAAGAGAATQAAVGAAGKTDIAAPSSGEAAARALTQATAGAGVAAQAAVGADGETEAAGGAPAITWSALMRLRGGSASWRALRALRRRCCNPKMDRGLESERENGIGWSTRRKDCPVKWALGAGAGPPWSDRRWDRSEGCLDDWLAAIPRAGKGVSPGWSEWMSGVGAGPLWAARRWDRPEGSAGDGFTAIPLAGRGVTPAIPWAGRGVTPGW